MKLKILYRGPLNTCNYWCKYCPFEKTADDENLLMKDRDALDRFTARVINLADDFESLEVFFTPKGEALVHNWYRDAITYLSNMPHIKKVAVQTNLSCDLAWFKNCCPESTAFWATYHPGSVGRDTFLNKCSMLTKLGIPFSVGIVGIKEHFDDIRLMRRCLPDDVYLWINAFPGNHDYYCDSDAAFLNSIDPLFTYSLRNNESFGKVCRTGETVISVNGQGDIFRCYFVQERLGNFYTNSIENILKRRPCPNPTCDCHIGYVHLEELEMEKIFSDGVLERIPLCIKC